MSGEGEVAPEVDRKATGLRWKMLKLVDDGMIACKINMDSGELTGRTCCGKLC